MGPVSICSNDISDELHLNSVYSAFKSRKGTRSTTSSSEGEFLIADYKIAFI